jgi:hypothetical protein
MAIWLLVHSPLLGPASWSGVATELAGAGHDVAVPDLRPALRGAGHYAERQAELAADGVESGPVILAGHSGAGPLLPAVVTALAARGVAVERCVFVDAGLPHPGRTRRETLPAELAANLESLTQDGWLPPWPQWWPPDALAELLPEPALRATLADDCPRLPAGLFDEPLPGERHLPAPAYVQLSAAYAEPAVEAQASGWPIERLSADHLATLTRPGEVARTMRDAAARPVHRS